MGIKICYLCTQSSGPRSHATCKTPDFNHSEQHLQSKEFLLYMKMLPLTNQKVTINMSRQITFMPVQKHTHRAGSSARLKALGVSYQRGSSHGVDTPGIECTSDREVVPVLHGSLLYAAQDWSTRGGKNPDQKKKRPTANNAPQAMDAAWSAHSAYTLNWDMFSLFYFFRCF